MKVNIGPPNRKNRAHHVHIDNHDVWSLDYTLANIIHPALVRLRERVPHFGYPTPYYETEAYPEYSQQGSFEEILDRGAESNYYEEQWMEKLQKMIDAFAMIIDKDEEYDKIMHHRDDEDARNAWDRKINEGLNLFSENYRGLWD
tara:strand:+ start:47 stop:481 length:435 start_codon:yes stop_codon:yes gene_type:complete